MAQLDHAYSLPEAPYSDVVGRSLDGITRLLQSGALGGAALRKRLPSEAASAFSGTIGRRSYTTGVRARLPCDMGKGIWDFFRISNSLFLSLTEAEYAQDTDVHLPDEEIIKIRILLDGELRLHFSERSMLIGPSLCISKHPADFENSYSFVPAQPQRMAVLHCRRSLVEEIVASALRGDVEQGVKALTAPAVLTLPLTAGIVETVNQLFSPPVHPGLADLYRRAKCSELLCTVVDLALYGLARDGVPGRERLSATIEQARALLLANLRDPPGLEALARLVGINQTKMKSAFREQVGLPVYEFVVRERIRLACSMLATTSLPISQIAFQVGYSQAGNFTAAFSRSLGMPPSAYRERFALQ